MGRIDTAWAMEGAARTTTISDSLNTVVGSSTAGTVDANVNVATTKSIKMPKTLKRHPTFPSKKPHANRLTTRSRKAGRGAFQGARKALQSRSPDAGQNRNPAPGVVLVSPRHQDRRLEVSFYHPLFEPSHFQVMRRPRLQGQIQSASLFCFVPVFDGAYLGRRAGLPLASFSLQSLLSHARPHIDNENAMID